MSESSQDVSLDSEAQMRARAERQVADARKLTRRRLFLVGSVVLIAVGFLLYKTLSSSITYFKTVDQALAARSTLKHSTFQLEGLVQSRSISYPSATSVDFVLMGTHGNEIVINNSGEPPELFRGNIPVVLVGHFVDGQTFVSDQILVKHSNSYIAAHPARVRAPNGSVH